MVPGFVITGATDGGVSISSLPSTLVPDLSLLTFAADSGCYSAFLGRIYYRDQLLAKYRNAGGSDADSPAALVLFAYRSAGRDILMQVEGDFAFAILDCRESSLYLVRDRSGGYPLFCHRSENRFFVSTSLLDISRLLPQARIRAEYLADFIAFPDLVNELPGESCVFEHVSRVPPGTALSLDTRTGIERWRATWRWVSNYVIPRSARLDDVACEYRTALTEAVAERLQGASCAHLSGGMDSTAVALIARDVLRKSCEKRELHTVSLVYRNLPALSRESSLIDALVDGRTALSHVIDGDELLDFDCLEAPPVHDEPYMGLWRLGMERALLQAASCAGAATVLTGIGADEMLDHQPFFLADLLDSGKFVAAWAESVRWARSEKSNVWGVLYPYGIARARRHGWSVLARLIGGQSSAKGVPSWILPEFARRFSLVERSEAYNARGADKDMGANMLQALRAIQCRTGDVVRWSVASPLGMSVVHPFLDSRILCLGLGHIAARRPTPGSRKAVLAEAMRNVLPEGIRKRKDKGHFNEVYFLGLQKNRAKLERLIVNCPVEDFQMINKEELIASLRRGSLGTSHVRDLHAFNSTVCLLSWLSHIRDWLSLADGKSQEVYHIDCRGENRRNNANSHVEVHSRLCGGGQVPC